MLSFRRTLSVEEERWQTFPGPETGLVAAPAALAAPQQATVVKGAVVRTRSGTKRTALG